MAFIRLSFTVTGAQQALATRSVDVVTSDIASDIVGAAEACRLPVRGPSGRVYVLHADGLVTQHPTTPQASFALTARPGSELLLWLVEGAAAASVLTHEALRLVVRVDLAGATADEQAATARAVDALLVHLVDVDLEAVLPERLPERLG